jgi:Fe-S-cluster-containing hydrogenase component 2
VQYVITIDADKCAGCRICEMVCSMNHTHECNPERSRIRVLLTEEEGSIENVPMTCMHCEKALCELACPTKAIRKDVVTGARVTDAEKCIGCRSCVYSCPVGATFYDWPQRISVRCDLCDGDPLCAKYCPTGAVEYTSVDKLGVRRMRQGAERLFQRETFTAPMGKILGETQTLLVQRAGQFTKRG